ILVAWDADLTGDEAAVLKKLTERLGYFGRAESLVEARVLPNLPANTEETHSISEPLSEFGPLPPKTELVRLLAPMSPEKYQAWRTAFLAAAPVASLGKKKPSKKMKNHETEEDSGVPRNLFAALQADTGDLQAAGWNLPPGAHFVNYT